MISQSRLWSGTPRAALKYFRAEEDSLRLSNALDVAPSATTIRDALSLPRSRGQKRAMRGAMKRRGGFSLLEVMIALVIFVVGALAIVRIFPGALGAVQTSENRGSGARIAQSTLLRYQSDPLSVPYATYDYDPTFNTVAGNWSDFDGATQGTRTRNASLPFSPPVKDDLANNPLYYQSQIGQSALGRFRYVMGEEHVVPSAAQSNIILTRFPYDVDTTTPGTPIPRLKIYRDVNVAGVTINTTGDLDFSQATVNSPSPLVPQGTTGASVSGKQDFHDTDPTIRERPPAKYRTETPPPVFFNNDRENTANRNLDPIFYVSYRWIDSARRVHGVTDEPKKFPNNTSWSAANARILASYFAPSIVAGPVKVRVRIPFIYSPTTSTFTVNQKAARGIGVYDSLSQFMAGDVIGFDYVVRDWRWLTVDGAASTPVSDPTDENGAALPQPPGDNVLPRQMELPIRYVTQNDPNTGESPLYTLFYGTLNNATLAPPAISDWSKESNSTPANTSPNVYPTGNSLWKVDPKSGRVTFNAGRGTPALPLQSLRGEARVVYQTVDGWAHQVSVAAKSYVRYAVPATPFTAATAPYFPREPWREYFFDPTNTDTAQRNLLFFHPADAGQSLMVSFEYGDTATGPYHAVANQLVTLNDRVSQPTLPASAAAFKGSARISGGIAATQSVVDGTLLDLSGKPINETITTARVTAILAVQGVSIRARSAWVDGDGYSQTGVVGYRKDTD